MPRYVAQWAYSTKAYTTRGDTVLYGPWRAGAEVELSEQEAAWVNRDSPGCLTLVPPEVEAEDAETDEADAEPVPDGTAQVVLEWVGSDVERATRALDAERQKDLPRSTLIAALERIAVPTFDRQHRGGFNRAGG